MKIKTHKELSPEQQFALKEINRCRNNPIYFLETYCKVLTEAPTPQPFKLYPFQKEKCIKRFLQYDLNIIVKGRQTGVSTVVAGYILWRMIFEEYFFAMVLAIGRKEAQNIISKIQLMINFLPAWLIPKQTVQNKESVGLENGSWVLALAKGKEQGRSYSPKLLVFDEAAFIDSAEELFMAARPSLAKTKGQLIAISTPNGYGNWYANTVFNAPENGFNAEWIYWHEMPDRDEEWKNREIQIMGLKAFEQEFNSFSKNEYISIRNKKTGIIEKITMGELYFRLELENVSRGNETI